MNIEEQQKLQEFLVKNPAEIKTRLISHMDSEGISDKDFKSMSSEINRLLSRFGGMIESRGPITIVNKDLQFETYLINHPENGQDSDAEDAADKDKGNYWQKLIKDINNYKTKTIPTEISMDVVSFLKKKKELKMSKSKPTKFVKKSELTTMMKNQLAHVFKGDTTSCSVNNKHTYNKSFQVKSLDREKHHMRSLSSTYLGNGLLTTGMTTAKQDENANNVGSTFYHSSFLSNQNQWLGQSASYRPILERKMYKSNYEHKAKGSLDIRNIDPSLLSESRAFGQTNGGPVYARDSLALKAATGNEFMTKLPFATKLHDEIREEGKSFLESRSQKQSSFLRESRLSNSESKRLNSMAESQSKPQIRIYKDSLKSSRKSISSHLLQTK
jgi:hypothetical protein